ncbi:ATP-binding protein [Burkholderia sp. Ac-20345]|uniref:AAA family ATPase n=1 Tax=Burkholderia sp. Ac-20345 TaxID=2703891 RepID=UPI00197C2D75|nr:ATP-binding protein [Burkholderia sp. Ac-20345]MBN3779321.1 ATP-binding protein [Burkholderia sp. Ac-20345]
MQQNSEKIEQATIKSTLQKLEELRQRTDARADHDSAQQWHQAISQSQQFLESRDHPIIFVGEVGVGKSSLVAVAARLLRSDTLPHDRSSLKSQSLLAIGAGRTTICEVHVSAGTPAENEAGISLEIEPIDSEEFDQLVSLWAEDEWRRRQGHNRMPEEAPPTPQEVSRALRAMAGYSERVESYRDGSLLRRRTIQPLDEVVPQFANAEALAEHLRGRMNLAQRSKRRWSWPDTSESSLQSLKETAEAINSGTERSAALPRSMTFVLPDILAGLSSALSPAETLTFELFDTRGLDAGVGLFGRPDLQEFVANERAVLVLCAPFKSAPGEAIRTFLLSVKADARWQHALKRTVVVLLDQGDADQVNGAGGDRQIGQEIKISECLGELSDVGLGDFGHEQIIALDVLADQRERLLEALKLRFEIMRKSVASELAQDLQNANDFLSKRGQENRTRLQQEVDRKIRESLDSRLPEGQPLVDPIAGLYAAVQGTRYASVIYASCRRRGIYRGLNLYEAIKAEASRSMSAWLQPPVGAVMDYLESSNREDYYSEISDFISLRKRQFAQGLVDTVTDFAAAVESEVKKALLHDDLLWRRCNSEWGVGGGFKAKVLEYVRQWASAQAFMAHADLRVVSKSIPFWGDVVKPARPPQFSLYVRQLRALRKVDWTPGPVSLLIGANGAGKSTTMQALRLLRLAYERSLPDAVRIILGGSHNLGSWGRKETEPIEIGVELGNVRWKVALNFSEGSVDPLAEEVLVEDGQVIFSRDALGKLIYKDQPIISEGGAVGLRTLVDRGAVESAIRETAAFLQRINVFQEPDLVSLRRGSSAEDDQGLELRGGNAISVLRRWHQNRSMKDRYDFVIGGLRAAFPGDFDELEFHQAGSTLTARIFKPHTEDAYWLMDAANGVLQLLVLLCEVANTEDGGVVAIDEPENGLHPYALRVFLRKAEQWATQHHITALLATHSTVLLDHFTDSPSYVFVMSKAEEHESLPVALDKLCDKDWLSGFKLGDLYEQGEIGSNDDK